MDQETDQCIGIALNKNYCALLTVKYAVIPEETMQYAVCSMQSYPWSYNNHKTRHNIKKPTKL